LNERLNLVAQRIHGAPDLVCEILSDRTAARDLGVKADRDLANGAREYWIVDPRDKSVQLWKIKTINGTRNGAIAWSRACCRALSWNAANCSPVE